MHNVKHPPSHDHVEQDGELDPWTGAHLKFFHAAPCFQDTVKNFDLPPTEVQVDHRTSLLKIGGLQAREQGPMDGFFTGRRVDLFSLHRPDLDHWQATIVAPWRLELHLDRPDLLGRDTSGATHLFATAAFDFLELLLG